MTLIITLAVIFGILLIWALFDILQKKHAIIHNFPVIGHFRYWLENIGPELRQYIVTDNNEERPFSRDQRRWVYASSKQENNYFGFGTDNDLETSPTYIIIKHSAFPLSEPESLQDKDYVTRYAIPCAKVLGAHRQRPKAFRPQSVLNVSGMSFGSLSSVAVEAINRGCAKAECLHNTGEGGVSKHHRHGADLVWQLGTAYFGCRTENGRFDEKRFVDMVQENPVKAIEIKLSQGAKPGLGGLLPAAKITAEIAAARGIPRGRDCQSPPCHVEFQNVDQMLDFVERLADLSGLPIGIKSAVGEQQFWVDLATEMANDTRGVDFITIDGGEGGTGAAPLAFADYVALPFKLGFTRIYPEFVKRDLHEKIVFAGSGKLGFPESSLLAMAMGCDLINVAREAMLSIGCIQALRCHSGHCPTGVATQNRWLMKGLDPSSKGDRLSNYLVVLRKEMLQLTRACGVVHPALLTMDDFDILDESYGSYSARDCFGYEAGWGIPSERDREAIGALMAR